MSGRPNQPARPAFSIIELLVVVGVLSVLIGLVIPALFSARQRAGAVRSLSNLRSAGGAFSLYHAAFNDTNPWAKPRKEFPISAPGEPRTTFSTSDPWAASTLWPALFHDVAPWNEFYATWIHPEVNPDGAVAWRARSGRFIPPVYEYCRSFQARPGVWPAAGTLTGAPEFRATTAGEVAFPASKALLVDFSLAYLRMVQVTHQPRGVLSFDGSASLRRDADSATPVQNLLTPDTPAPYHDTLQGVKGRDY